MTNPNEMSGERRSHPGNAGTFVRKKRALKGELHSGVRSCGRFLLNGFVIHNRCFLEDCSIELCRLSRGSENRAPPAAGGVESFRVRSEQLDRYMDEALV